jgi:hypothetical protein
MVNSGIAVMVALLSAIFMSLMLFWRSYGNYIYTTGVALISSNPFLQAVAVPSLLGFVIYFLQFVWDYLFYNFVAPHLYSYITIRSSESEFFEAVLDFVQDQQLIKASHLMACKKNKTETMKELEKRLLNGDSNMPDLVFRPANSGGLITMKYKGSTIYVTRMVGETITVGYSRKAIQMESLTLSVFGSNTDILQSFIKEALERTKAEQSEDLNIYAMSTGWLEGWELVRYAFCEFFTPSHRANRQTPGI